MLDMSVNDKIIKVGDIAPLVTFKQRRGDVTPGADGCSFDGEWFNTTSDELFNGKKVVIFSLPGAFTPTCTSLQVPGFEELHKAMTNCGVDDVYCISVNDAFVMNAWADCLGLKNVKVLPDGNGEFTDAVGMLVSKSDIGFGFRSWRYSAVIDNGVFTYLGVEDFDATDEDPYVESTPEKVLNFLLGKS